MVPLQAEVVVPLQAEAVVPLQTEEAVSPRAGEVQEELAALLARAAVVRVVDVADVGADEVAEMETTDHSDVAERTLPRSDKSKTSSGLRPRKWARLPSLRSTWKP